jgi:hypothetical protein
MRKGCPLLRLSVHVVLKVLASVIRQEKEIKVIYIRAKEIISVCR